MARQDESDSESSKDSALEKVLTYFPDASLYQFGLFIFWKV